MVYLTSNCQCWSTNCRFGCACVVNTFDRPTVETCADSYTEFWGIAVAIRESSTPGPHSFIITASTSSCRCKCAMSKTNFIQGVRAVEGTPCPQRGAPSSDVTGVRKHLTRARTVEIFWHLYRIISYNNLKPYPLIDYNTCMYALYTVNYFNTDSLVYYYSVIYLHQPPRRWSIAVVTQ